MRKNNQSGQAIIAIVLLFLVVSSTAAFGLARSVHNTLKNSSDFLVSRSSYFLSESLGEDVVYKFVKGMTVPANPTMTLDGSTAQATVTDIVGGKEIISSGNKKDLIRRSRMRLSFGTGASFFYGVQVGDGGLVMSNTSSVYGNVFSSGPIRGTGNYIRGDALSSGPNGLISNIHATSSAYAHRIENSTIEKHAYFVELVNTTVGGTQYPNSPDQATTSLPISDEQIEEWESDAALGGTVTCTNGSYVISSNMTIGPKKIPCNLEIQGSGTVVTLGGALWVLGDINVSNSVTVRVSSSILNRTIPVIAHNPADEINSSKIVLANSATFQGSGNNSYILMVSQNRSASVGGTVKAIDLRNTASGEILLYAPHGNVDVTNNLDIREVTAYKLTLGNSAKVIYKSGMASILFASGPGGGFQVFDWREVE